MLSKPEMENFVSEMYTNSLPDHFHYHNFEHSLYVAKTGVEIGIHEGCTEVELTLLYMAGLWHDCGYLHTYQNHEEESCNIARKFLPGFGVSESDIETICGMIMATKIPHLPKNKLEEIIADADLEYLGTENAGTLAYELYKELQHNNSALTEKEWDKKQIAFIENHRYFTSYCVEKNEAMKADYLRLLREKTV